ncbi:unnamed protein product, partial [marine sediment metagenome]
MLFYIKKSWESEELEFSGTIAKLKDRFAVFLNDLYKMEWV